MSARPDRSLNGWQLEVMAEIEAARRRPVRPVVVASRPSSVARLRSRISPYGLAVVGLVVVVGLPVVKLAPLWLAWLGRVLP
jgi:hypothetical protein